MNKRYTWTICCLMMPGASMALLGQGPPEALPTSTRIEIMQGNTARRGVVSEDKGPQAATIKVRIEPTNDMSIVPRNTVRLAPRPTSIKVGDRLEWNGSSVTSFKYVPATVKGIGSGSMQGYYLMATDDYPNSPSYTKEQNLWTLPQAGSSTAPANAGGLTPGKYRCFAGKIFLGSLDLRSDGSYTASTGSQGRYTMNAASNAIVWQSGWGKENNFQGNLEGNALIRLTRSAYCSHE